MSGALRKQHKVGRVGPSNASSYDVAIVGGGIAALMAARQLVSQLHDDHTFTITILEKEDYIGGRIKGDSIFLEGDRSHTIDVGAELVHGNGTPLTDLITELFPDDKLHEHFIIAHADGGPSPRPIVETGQYGVYYVNGEMHHFQDERLLPLHQALGGMHDESAQGDGNNNVLQDPEASVGEYLSRFSLEEGLQRLAIASYGNTAGCTDHTKLSLSMLSNFEDWWEENEEEGDHHFERGFHAIISRLVEELEANENVTIRRNVNVLNVTNETTSTRQVRLLSCQRGYEDLSNPREETSLFDAVIVTVPPPFWPDLLPELDPAKLDALAFLGSDPAMKVIVALQHPVWPSEIACCISGDHLIPEMWFRKVEPNFYLVVGFLTSGAAKRLCEALLQETDDTVENNEKNDSRTGRAQAISVSQLADIFGQSIDVVRNAVVSTKLVEWKIGYMHPQVGMRPHHLRDLAAPMGNIYFAGEATHTGACMTVQAAISTGARAAMEVTASLQ